jgi:ribosome-binding factor A
MSSRRLLKAASAIREVISQAILFEMRDPRVANVTVTFVEVAPDMRTAKVHVSIMGDETKQQLALRGLTNAAGFLQSKIADGIDTRYTPRLSFVLDLGVKHSIEVSRILKEVLPSDEAGTAGVGDLPDADDYDDLSDDEASDDDDSPDDSDSDVSATEHPTG